MVQREVVEGIRSSGSSGSLRVEAASAIARREVAGGRVAGRQGYEKSTDCVQEEGRVSRGVESCAPCDLTP